MNTKESCPAWLVRVGVVALDGANLCCSPCQWISCPTSGKIYVNGPPGTAGADETLMDRLKLPYPTFFFSSFNIWADRYTNT